MIERPSQTIIDAIEAGTVRIARRAEFYEKDGVTIWVPEGTTEDGGAPIPRLLTEGSVNLSYDRDERRTCDLNFDNYDGALRPQREGLWYDKVIKLFRGLYVGTADPTWWQIGEFVIDNIDDDNFPHKVHVVGRDYTKRMMNSKLKNSASFASGEKLVDVVKALAINSGIPAAKLTRIPTWTRTIGSRLDYERNTPRWEIAKAAAAAKKADLWFDAEGYLRLTEFPDPTAGAIEWVFKTGKSGNLVKYSRSVNDSELYNIVQVQGAAPDSGLPAFYEAKNTEPSSPTSVDKIGERVMPLVQLDAVSTTAECKEMALALLKVAGLESYNLQYESVHYPWFEVGSVVQVLEDDRIVGDPTRFLLTELDMPISLGPMSSTGKRVTVVGEVAPTEFTDASDSITD